jgi:hypothetical protein
LRNCLVDLLNLKTQTSHVDYTRMHSHKMTSAATHLLISFP